MSQVVLKFWRIIVAGLSVPVILLDYFHGDTGREYKVGFFRKCWLVYKMARNRAKITTASHWLEHLIMATHILRVPPGVEGCVVECGSFKGGSAANLSLVCALCNRTLEICDSFQGLPEPLEGDKSHAVMNQRELHTYTKGEYEGSLSEVQKNITRCGRIDSCHFNVGFFEQTLPTFRRKCILAFLDVDLTESLKTCLTYLWPLLQDGCFLFTHEAHHMEIAGQFFDDPWWRLEMQTAAPGLIGAGTGLGLFPFPGGYKSSLGYTMKNPALAEFRANPQLSSKVR